MLPYKVRPRLPILVSFFDCVDRDALRGDQINAFAAEDQFFDGDFGGAGAKRGTGPLTGPGVGEFPGEHRVVGRVEKDDGDGDASDVAGHGGVDPVPEGKIADDAPLESDVGDLGESGELSRGVDRGIAGAVVDDLDRDFQAADLAERGRGDALNFHPEVAGVEGAGVRLSSG